MNFSYSPPVIKIDIILDDDVAKPTKLKSIERGYKVYALYSFLKDSSLALLWNTRVNLFIFIIKLIIGSLDFLKNLR